MTDSLSVSPISQSTTSKHVAVLLAAGQSSRLGRPKQFLPWQGRPLIRYMAEIILQTRPAKLVVVTGEHHQRINALLHDLPVDCVFNPYWQTGMASSLQQAHATLDAMSWPCILVTVCDQPFLTASHLSNLVAHNLQQGGKRSSITRYGHNKTGVPACLSRKDFAMVSHLRGDQGFRHIWAELEVMPEPDKTKANKAQRTENQPLCLKPDSIFAPELAFDIDTEGDYQQLLSLSSGVPDGRNP